MTKHKYLPPKDAPINVRKVYGVGVDRRGNEYKEELTEFIQRSIDNETIIVPSDDCCINIDGGFPDSVYCQNIDGGTP